MTTTAETPTTAAARCSAVGAWYAVCKNCAALVALVCGCSCCELRNTSKQADLISFMLTVVCSLSRVYGLFTHLFMLSALVMFILLLKWQLLNYFFLIQLDFCPVFLSLLAIIQRSGPLCFYNCSVLLQNLSERLYCWCGNQGSVV